MLIIKRHILRIYEQDRGYSLYVGDSSGLDRHALDHETAEVSRTYLLAQKRLDGLLGPNRVSWSVTFRYDDATACPLVAYGGYFELPAHKNQSGIRFIHAIELYSSDDLHRSVSAILAVLSARGIHKLRRAVIRTAAGAARSNEESLEIVNERE